MELHDRPWSEEFHHRNYALVISSRALTSGKPVNGVVSTPDGIAYTFTAVAWKHVTLAITNPKVSPSGNNLQMQVYDSSWAMDASGVLINTTRTEIDFMPTSPEAGTTTVVISPYNFETTGSFTLTYSGMKRTEKVPIAERLPYGVATDKQSTCVVVCKTKLPIGESPGPGNHTRSCINC